MRVSLHGGSKGSAKHNQHEFEAKHINKDKTKDNQYFLASGNTCEEAELNVYTELYGDYLAKKNKEHINRRQYDRVREMSEWLKAPRYRAREEILQIGDMDTHGNIEDLKACINEYNMWKYSTFGDNCRFISCALHADESTPHAHSRDTWFWHDKDGNKVPGLNKALEEVGVQLPNPNLPEGKNNNRLQTYTEMCRGKWQEICIAHGFEIETEPKEEKQEHMSAEAYKAYKRAMKEVEAEKSMLEALKEQIEVNTERLEAMQKQLEQEVDDFVKQQEKKEKDFQHKEDALEAQNLALEKEMMRYKLSLKSTYDEKYRNYKKSCDEKVRIALEKVTKLPQMSDVVERTLDSAYVRMRMGEDMPARTLIEKQQQWNKRQISDIVTENRSEGFDFEF